MIMYLSVTPHIYPTRTGRTEDGRRKPICFSSPGAYDTEPASDSIDVNLDRHVKAAQNLAEKARGSAEIQAEEARNLRKAFARGDQEAAEKARNTMWKGIYQAYKAVYEQGSHWNDLAPRATGN